MIIYIYIYIYFNFNLVLFADDTSVSISEPSNKTLCTSLNLVILNLHE